MRLGYRTVLANGCFDVFHAGHVWHLQAARAMGDRLIVALTMDEHVNKGEGRPINPWWHRAAVLTELSCVDLVVPSVSALQAINDYRPDIFVKGVDYAGDGRLQMERVLCKSLGVELRTTMTPKLGSGDIIRRIKQCECL